MENSDATMIPTAAAAPPPQPDEQELVRGTGRTFRLLVGTDGGEVGAQAALVVSLVRVGGCFPAVAARVWHWSDVPGIQAAEQALLELFAAAGPPAAWHAEEPFALAAAPKAGVRQGSAIGWWRHVAAVAGLELTLISPAVWRRAWGVPHGPGATAAAARHSRRLVGMLWPELAAGPADHGCDAVLVAGHDDPDVLAWATRRLRELAAAGDADARQLLVAMVSGGTRVGRRRRATTATTAPAATAPARAGTWTEELVAAHLARLGGRDEQH